MPKSRWMEGSAMLTMLPSSVAIMEPSETLERISHLRCTGVLGLRVGAAVGTGEAALCPPRYQQGRPARGRRGPASPARPGPA